MPYRPAPLEQGEEVRPDPLVPEVRASGEVSELPLMFQAYAAEFQKYHAPVDPWHPMPPPAPGNYLVRVEIEDAARGVVMRSVRLDWFDGGRFPRAGGYVSYTGWQPLPAI